MSKKIQYSIETFGCKVNTYDSSLLQKRFAKSELESVEQNPQVYILNTCAVTHEATKEALRRVRKIKKQNPDSKIVITGCSAQVDKKFFENSKDVDLVVANSHKGNLENYIQQALRGELKQKIYHSNIFKKEDLEIGGGLEENHTRAFLKIQDGCNSFCSYCVIPFARGKSRSIPVTEITQKINELYSKGIREVVLTGVHIGDYESKEDGKTYKYDDLVEAILLQTPMPRLRLTSLEPVEITEKLFELYQDDRMCSHFHMSIQSANTDILSDMKRQYSAKDVEWSLEQIQKRIPNAFVGMDVIVGFPGESDKKFRDTMDRLAALDWTRIHVFPYSERPGTRATRLDGHIYPHVRAERAKEMRAMSLERYTQKALAQVGEFKKAMILKKPARGAIGLSRDYWPVDVDLDPKILQKIPGEEVLVKITGYDHSNSSRIEGCLKGIPLDA